jgi:hypothetical protein
LKRDTGRQKGGNREEGKKGGGIEEGYSEGQREG